MTDISEADAWLVVKRDLYYRPGGKGYTGIRDHAGRYSYEEAKSNESPNENGNPVTIVKLTDAPQFAKACFDDLARDHLIEVVAERDATIRSLSLKVEELEKEVSAGSSNRSEPGYVGSVTLSSEDVAALRRLLVKAELLAPHGSPMKYEAHRLYMLFVAASLNSSLTAGHVPETPGGQLEPILPTSSPSPHGEPE